MTTAEAGGEVHVAFCEAASPVKHFGFRSGSVASVGSSLRMVSRRDGCHPSVRARLRRLFAAAQAGGWTAPSTQRLSTEASRHAALVHRNLFHLPVTRCRAFVRPGCSAVRYAALDFGLHASPNRVPSRHIAYRIPASLRANATAATRLPRRTAILSAQPRSAAVSDRS